MEKYTKKDGYYKYYNSEGKKCRIKIEPELLNGKNFKVFVWFKKEDDAHWLVHQPKKKFRDAFHVINFILKNLENDNLIFKITKASN